MSTGEEHASVARRRAGGAESHLSVRFWGVRGSFGVSGRDFEQFGGNTACVEVRLGRRLVVIDAGTGIIGLGRSLPQGGHREVDLMLSHLHLDHITGLVFFEPLLRAGTTVRIHCGHLSVEAARQALDRVFSEPVFPLPLHSLPGHVEVVGFTAGETLRLAGGVSVATCPLDHPGGGTGYRFDHRGHSVCYLSDMEHRAGGHRAALVAFARDADLVIYDAMYRPSQYPRHKGWGHSTWEAGVALCRAAGARAMAGFHHHPHHDDAAMLAMERELAEALPGSFFAREGQTVRIGGPAGTD